MDIKLKLDTRVIEAKIEVLSDLHRNGILSEAEVIKQINNLKESIEKDFNKYIKIETIV